MEGVELEIDFAGDAATVPSRALLIELAIGIPEQRFGLMLDFGWHDGIHVDACLNLTSRTYSSGGRDLVAFEEPGYLSPDTRARFRMAVTQHCIPNSMSQRLYRNCFGAHCNGVVDLSLTHSSLWNVWTAFSLSTDKLTLGRRRHPDQAHASFDVVGPMSFDTHGSLHTFDCGAPDVNGDETMCAFDASIMVGRTSHQVVVDFHVHDSYVYLPLWLYTMYQKAEHSFAVEPRVRTLGWLDVDAGDKRVDAAAEDARVRKEFTDAYTAQLGELPLCEGQTARESPPPLVIVSRDTNQVVLVLDCDQLVHHPRRSEAENLFGALYAFNGEHATAFSRSSLVRPHHNLNNTRISIGNNVLTRYIMHRDLIEDTMTLERTHMREHLSLNETVLVALLVALFVRSCTRQADKFARRVLRGRERDNHACVGGGCCTRCATPKNVLLEKLHALVFVFVVLAVGFASRVSLDTCVYAFVVACTVCCAWLAEPRIRRATLSRTLAFDTNITRECAYVSSEVLSLGLVTSIVSTVSNEVFSTALSILCGVSGTFVVVRSAVRIARVILLAQGVRTCGRWRRWLCGAFACVNVVVLLTSDTARDACASVFPTTMHAHSWTIAVIGGSFYISTQCDY